MPRTERRWLLAAGAAALIGVPLLALGWVRLPEQTVLSLLWTSLFWLGLSAGSLALLMIHGLTGGRWGRLAGPALRAGAAALPLALVPFVLLLAALDGLFPWTAPLETLPHAVQAKKLWLDAELFALRTLVYASVWTLLAWLFAAGRRPAKGTAAAGLILHTLVVTFFAFDWVMSLTPEWFSSIFGVLVGGGQLVAGGALALLVVSTVAPWRGQADAAVPRRDLGNLVMGLLLLWAYFAFSQFLIIWSADLPHETLWYLERSRHGWSTVAVLLVALQFALPFAALISRTVKASPRLLGWVAGLVIAGHLVDAWWLVAPGRREAAWHLAWTDAAAFAAVGGPWLLLFIWRLGRSAADSPAPSSSAAEARP